MKSLFVLLGLSLISVLVTAQTAYLNAAQFISGSIGTCTLGTNDNICIANAIQAIPGTPGSTGGYAIIDATGLGVNGAEIWTSNPFVNIISNGTTNFTTPVKCGTLLLNSGHSISENLPFWIPRCWDVIWTTSYSQGGRGIIASASFPSIITGTSTNPAGSVISTGQYQFTVTASSNFSTTPGIGQMFAVCQNNGVNGPNCGGNGTTTCSTACGANAWGIILAVPAANQVIVGANNAAHANANASNVNFVIWGDLVSLGTVSQTGSDGGGSSSTITGGSYSCNDNANVGAALANFSVQEKSYWKNVQIQHCITSAMTVQSSGAVNTGPYEGMVINEDSSCLHTTVPIIIRIPGVTKRFSNFTINGDEPNCADTNIDLESGTTISDFHTEDTSTDSNNNTVISIGENTSNVPIVTCPVMCVEPTNAGLGARVEGASIAGAYTNVVLIGSAFSTSASVFIDDIQGNATLTNTINDTAINCTISGANGDNWIQLYARNGINATVVSTSSNVSSTCPRTLQTPYRTQSAATNTNIGNTAMVTSPNDGANHSYTLNWYVSLVTAGTGCTSAVTVVLNGIWFDPSATAAQTVPLSTITLAAAGTQGTVGQIASGSQTMLAKPNTGVRYTTTGLPSGGCTTVPTYQVTPVLVQNF
jgi:hypothetical protein